jgi:hypothetical protein
MSTNGREDDPDRNADPSVCNKLDRVSADLRLLVRAHCPFCTGTGHTCILARVHQALAVHREPATGLQENTYH